MAVPHKAWQLARGEGSGVAVLLPVFIAASWLDVYSAYSVVEVKVSGYRIWRSAEEKGYKEKIWTWFGGTTPLLEGMRNVLLLKKCILNCCMLIRNDDLWEMTNTRFSFGKEEYETKVWSCPPSHPSHKVISVDLTLQGKGGLSLSLWKRNMLVHKSRCCWHLIVFKNKERTK